jgi:hypothetical protein
MICATCGADVPALGLFCSAIDALTCQGRAPVPGCGGILTPDERHWYGSSCELCQRAWYDRIDAWLRGHDDAELEQMFGSQRALQ